MSLFEQILNTNLINFIIVISTLALIFKKAHLGDLLEKMAQNIKLEVEKSADSAKCAIEEYKETKKSTKDTPKLQEEIISNAKNNAQNLKDNIDKAAQIQEDEIKKTLDKIKSAQSGKLKSQTANDIYQACVSLAYDETMNLLDENMHKKLIDSAIEDLCKAEGSLL